MANTDDAWNALSRTTDWVKVADTKAGMVIAANGVLGGLLLRAIPPFEQWGGTPWRAGLLVAGLILACVSTLLSLRVFAPRLRAGEAPSLLYFDHVARYYPRSVEFSRAYLALLEQEERLQESLADQLWATSRVAHRKFRSVTPAIWLLGTGLLLAIGGGLVPA